MTKYLIATKGQQKGLAFEFENEDYLIGRDPDLVDFVIEDRSVSRKHALLKTIDDKTYIENLSTTNPIEINKEKIEHIHELKESDIISIGLNNFKYTEKKPRNKTFIKIEKEEKNQTEEKLEEKTIVDIEEPSSIDENDFIEEDIEKENLQAIEDNNSEEEETYNTIFEEEVDEELPEKRFMEDTIILKVISGPNAGAEFAMTLGHFYIIGKDPSSSDIVFNDLSVSKNHAKLSLENDGSIYIEDLGSKNGTILNSEKKEEKTKISSKDLISLGTTTFTIIDPKEAYETIYSPTYEEVTEETRRKPEAKEKELWKKEIVPKNHLVIGGSIALTLIIMFISFFSLFKSEKIEVAKKEPVKEIEEVLEKYPSVEFSYNPLSRRLFLTGHLLTDIKEKELIYDIKGLNFVNNLENNIIIDEHIWKNTNDLLSENANWKSIFLNSKMPGDFVITGYVDSEREFENLMDWLKLNFDFIENLSNEVVIENILQMEIQSKIIEKGLSAISFQLLDGEVILSGRYSEENKKNFENFSAEIKKLKGIRSIKNLALMTTADMARINITKKYKVSGFISLDDKEMLSVIANDQIVSKGEYLDEMKVTAINPNSIYLEKDGIKYKIDYKQD